MGKHTKYLKKKKKQIAKADLYQGFKSTGSRDNCQGSNPGSPLTSCMKESKSACVTSGKAVL